MLEAVQDDVVALSNHTPDLNTFTWVLHRHSVEVINEAVFAIWHTGIVLSVSVAYIPVVASFGRHWLNIRS